MTNWVENLGSQLRKSGKCEAWFVGADPDVRQIAHDVNGPLCEASVAECAYEDPLVAEVFRTGAPLNGDMPVCGIVKPSTEGSSAHDVEALRNEIWRSSKMVAKELRMNAFEEFHVQVEGDARPGWMAAPTKTSGSLLDTRAVPRIGVHQG